MIEKGQKTWIVTGISVLSINKTLNWITFSNHFSTVKKLKSKDMTAFIGKAVDKLEM